jgi:hypothetical protein
MSTMTDMKAEIAWFMEDGASSRQGADRYVKG